MLVLNPKHNIKIDITYSTKFNALICFDVGHKRQISSPKKTALKTHGFQKVISR